MWLTTQRFEHFALIVFRRNTENKLSHEDNQSILIETFSRLPLVLFRTNTT